MRLNHQGELSALRDEKCARVAGDVLWVWCGEAGVGAKFFACSYLSIRRRLAWQDSRKAVRVRAKKSTSGMVRSGGQRID